MVYPYPDYTTRRKVQQAARYAKGSLDHVAAGCTKSPLAIYSLCTTRESSPFGDKPLKKQEPERRQVSGSI